MPLLNIVALVRELCETWMHACTFTRDQLLIKYLPVYFGGWWFGLVGNALASINVVALRQTRLVPRWVTDCGRVNISVCNQPTRSTQPSTLRGTVK